MLTLAHAMAWAMANPRPGLSSPSTSSVGIEEADRPASAAAAEAFLPAMIKLNCSLCSVSRIASVILLSRDPAASSPWRRDPREIPIDQPRAFSVGCAPHPRKGETQDALSIFRR